MARKDWIISELRRHLWWVKEVKPEIERWKFLFEKAKNGRESVRGAGPNVLLLSVDSMAARHLGCYGYHRPTSPNLDRLAQGGVLFENVIAQSNWTKPALASLLTSLYPSVHRTDSRGETGDRVDVEVRNRAHVLDDRFRILTEEFRDAGYHTAGLSNGGYAHSFFGFGRGFGYYDNEGGGLKSCAYRLLQWVLRNPGAPFFGWIHCWDLHFPYMDRPPYNRKFVKRRTGIVLDAATRHTINDRARALTEQECEFLKGLYDGALSYVDDQVGALMRELERLGLSQNTILAITADHGEAFFEHGFVEHTECLYGEVVHVPLILCGPGLSGGRRIRPQVRSLDIMPTLLDLCGLAPKAEIQGVSLLPWITGECTRHLPGGSETERGGGQTALSDGRYKVIRRKDRVEIYDLAENPEEKVDLASRRPEICAAMEAQLSSWEQETRRCAERYWSDRKGEDSAEMSAEVVQRLKDLGYLE